MVPTYNWQMFLFEHEHTKKLVGIKSFHHLQFSSINKGHIFAQETSEVKNLLKHKWTLTVTILPERITPFGLSPTCQWHCFNKVRDRRVTECRMPRLRVPDPSAAETTTSSTISTTSTTTTISTSAAIATTADLSEPAPKRPRYCGVCREEGHNAHSCPTKIDFYVNCVRLQCLSLYFNFHRLWS